MSTYIIYITINLIDNKKYYGVHKSSNLEKDVYLGSGYLLKLAIKKYGRENFKRENLFNYYNLKDAFNKDREIISQ